MIDGKLENGTTNDSLSVREVKKKGTILRSQTLGGKSKARIQKYRSEEVIKKTVKFADSANKPIHVIIDFKPYKCERGYSERPLISTGPGKKSKGCACLVF